MRSIGALNEYKNGNSVKYREKKSNITIEIKKKIKNLNTMSEELIAVQMQNKITI